MKVILLTCAMLSLFFNVNNAFSAEFVQLDEDRLASVKASIKNANASSETLNAYQALITKADSLLDIKAFSVTHKTIPTKDAHDYVSISRYWWPDTTKKNGLPWLRRDGETNPDTQTDMVDRVRMGAMTNAVRDLSYAYYFTDNEAYAKKGTELIRVWFLDKETRMNPNLNFAQIVPGNDRKRRSGILDGRLIPQWVLDAIIVFSKSNYWSDDDNTKMNAWLRDYLKWLTKSSLGKEGAKQTNNHGSWYQFQVTALAWYLGEAKTLKRELKRTKALMEKQFNAQGAQKHELKRTKSFFYSCFNLDALTRIAIIGDKAGDSLWDHPSSASSELFKAINYLMPVAQGEPWPHPTKGVNLSHFIPVLDRYADKTGSQEHKALLKRLLEGSKENTSTKKSSAAIYNTFALFKPDALE